MKPWTAEQYPLETVDKAPTEDKILAARQEKINLMAKEIYRTMERAFAQIDIDLETPSGALEELRLLLARYV